MSTIPTVAVSIILHEQDGSPIEGAEIEAKLETLEKYQGFVVPDLVEAVTDENGTAILNLFPNELGSESSEYRFKLSYSNGCTDTIYAVVPNLDCELHNLTELDHFEYRSIGAVITKQIADDVADAKVTKAVAEEAAATSVEARDVTLQAKTEVLAAQEVVATDKATVADLKAQTEAARDTSVAAASEAVGVRDILVAARDEAVDAANTSVNAANTAIAESVAAGTAKTAAEAAQIAAEGAAIQTGLDKNSVVADKVIVVNAKDEAVAASAAASVAQGAAEAAKTAAQSAKANAEAVASTAVNAKDEAVAAKQSVDTAVTTVTTAKAATVTAKTDAEAAATTAVGAKDTAVTEATTATTKASEAADSATAAGGAATSCLQIKNECIQLASECSDQALLFKEAMLGESRFLVAENYSALSILPYTRLAFFSGGVLVFWQTKVAVSLDVPSLLDAGVMQSGKDYSLYLVDNAGTIEFSCSLDKVAPAGHTVDTSKRIGGFHTVCADYGSIVGHPLSDLTAGSILPPSVWCTTHRPTCDPSGMTYESQLGFWVDIYLQSGTGYDTASAYGATHTVSRQWDLHTEDMRCVGKTLLTDAEFAAAAEGSNQKTNIQGSSDKGTVGGNVDTAGRRMVSHCGCEEMCGYLWQWVDNPSANGGSGWVTIPGNKGDLYGSSYSLLAGGRWSHGADCGSRARYGADSRLHVFATVGGRGRASSR